MLSLEQLTSRKGQVGPRRCPVPAVGGRSTSTSAILRDSSATLCVSPRLCGLNSRTALNRWRHLDSVRYPRKPRANTRRLDTTLGKLSVVKRNIAAAAAAGAVLLLGGCTSSPQPRSPVTTSTSTTTTTLAVTTTSAVTPPPPTTRSVAVPTHNLPISVSAQLTSDQQTPSVLLPSSCQLQAGVVTAKGAVSGPLPEVYIRFGDVVELYAYDTNNTSPLGTDAVQVLDLAAETPGSLLHGLTWVASAPMVRGLPEPLRCFVAIQSTHAFMAAGNAGG